jgi:hypothetical protein
MDYPLYKKLFNQQMDAFLDSSGLATECLLTYGVKDLEQCPNCLYDSALKKSANIYKTGGPTLFSQGQICPHCRGVGLYGNAKTESVYLAVLWDYKSWVIKPVNIENPQGYIQTICHKSYTSRILQAQEMTIPNMNPDSPTFILDSEPNPGGLGDQNYIICTWKKIRK